MLLFFFFNDTATTEIYTLSLHDALPISDLEEAKRVGVGHDPSLPKCRGVMAAKKEDKLGWRASDTRSEEHTSELQSLAYLVCRLLLEKKKKRHHIRIAVSCDRYTHNEHA